MPRPSPFLDVCLLYVVCFSRAERYLGESNAEASRLTNGTSGTGASVAAKEGVRVEKERRAPSNDRVRADKDKKADIKKAIKGKEAGVERDDDDSLEDVRDKADKAGSLEADQRGKDGGGDEVTAAGPDGDVMSSSSSICTVPGAPPSPLTLVSHLSEATTEGGVSQPNSLSGVRKLDGGKDEGIVLGRVVRSARVVKKGSCAHGQGWVANGEGANALMGPGHEGDEKDLAAALLQLHQGLGESLSLSLRRDCRACVRIS